MTLAPIQGKCPVCHQDSANTAFQAGAASRDAEIQRLQFALSDTEALECGTAEKCDKLRAQINSLREALEKILSQESDNGSILSAGNCAEIAYEALASIPEQSLAEYRNKVIEDCAVTVENCEPDDNGRLSIQEIAEAVLAMNEQQ